MMRNAIAGDIAMLFIMIVGVICVVSNRADLAAMNFALCNLLLLVRVLMLEHSRLRTLEALSRINELATELKRRMKEEK